MADAASIVVTATILPDEIQKALDAVTITVTPTNASEKWFYGLINVTNSSADLIAGNFLSNSAGKATGSSSAAITTSDVVRFLFIKNTATTDGTTASTEAINICFDGGTAAYNLVDGLEIGTGEVWFGKLPNTTVGNLHAISVDTNMGGSGSAGEANVQCMVAAIIDDVA
jgi:hypothetical protein